VMNREIEEGNRARVCVRRYVCLRKIPVVRSEDGSAARSAKSLARTACRAAGRQSDDALRVAAVPAPQRTRYYADRHMRVRPPRAASVTSRRAALSYAYGERAEVCACQTSEARAVTDNCRVEMAR